MKGELYIVCQGEVCQTKGKLHYLVGTPDPVDDQTYCTKRGQFRELVNSEKYWCIENRDTIQVSSRPVAAWYSLVRQEKRKSVLQAKRAKKILWGHAHFFIMTPRQHQHHSAAIRTADISQHEKISSPVYCQIPALEN